MKYIRQRYILFEIITEIETEIPEDVVLQAIWKQIIHLFGEITTFHVGLWMIRYDSAQHLGIIRCDNITKTQVIAAMAVVKNIQNFLVVFHTRKTTGTIKSALDEWKQYFTIPPPPRKPENSTSNS